MPVIALHPSRPKLSRWSVAAVAASITAWGLAGSAGAAVPSPVVAQACAAPRFLSARAISDGSNAAIMDLFIRSSSAACASREDVTITAADGTFTRLPVPVITQSAQAVRGHVNEKNLCLVSLPGPLQLRLPTATLRKRECESGLLSVAIERAGTPVGHAVRNPQQCEALVLFRLRGTTGHGHRNPSVAVPITLAPFNAANFGPGNFQHEVRITVDAANNVPITEPPNNPTLLRTCNAR